MENRVVESANESKEMVMANLGLSQSDDKIAKSESTQKVEENEELDASQSDEGLDEVMDDAVSEEDDKDEQSKKGKKQGGFQKKINKLTGRALTAEQERDFWKQEALKAKDTPQEEAKAEKVEAKSNEPNIDDFETYNDYVKALTKYEISTQRENDAKEAQKKTEQAKAQAKVQTLQSKIEEFAKVNEDYHDVVQEVDDVAVQQGLISIILESENPALLNYELAKNRVELERINSLPPREAALALLRFEAKIQPASDEKTETKEIKTTQAARPLKPVGASSKANITVSPYEKEMSYTEYKEWAAKQKIKK